MRCRICAALVTGLMAVATLGVAQESTGNYPALDRLLRWLKAAEAHTPGDADLAVIDVGSWLRSDFVPLVGDLRRLSTFLQRARSGSDPFPSIRLYNRRFTLVEVEKIFHGNDTLRKGAVLHADIAILGADSHMRRSNAIENSSVFVVDDGRGSGVRYESAHWAIGRGVLDSMTPATSSDPGALLWYRAASASLLRDGHLGAARAHLDRARQIFPTNVFLLLDSGYLHQKFSSIAIQAAVQSLRSEGASPAVDSRRVELDRTERFFRQALTVDPSQAAARTRLGHTLGELGRHEEAAAELRRAIDARLDGPQLYFAELFLGREEQALHRLDAAKLHYENAAELYVKAQSPSLALSQLARESGDRPGALRALRGVTALSSGDVNRWDPWWDYYDSHVEDADSLIHQMRQIATVRTP